MQFVRSAISAVRRRPVYAAVGLALAGLIIHAAGCASPARTAVEFHQLKSMAGLPAATPQVADQSANLINGAVAPETRFQVQSARAQSAGGRLAALSASEPSRFLIRNATLTLEAGDPRRVEEQLIAAVNAAHGYVSNMHESVDSLGERSVTIQVRVPCPSFDDSMQQIQGLGKVLEKEVTTEDVTEEYVDSQAKLRNLRRTEARLLAHLSRTGKLSDTLLVEQSLTRVDGSIDELEGRLRYLAHRVEYSTLDITIQETARPHAVVPPETYSTGKIASDAIRSLVGFGQSAWSVLIWCFIWSIVWAPGVILAWQLWKRLGRRR